MPKVQNEPLTFEKVWAALMENREQIKEISKKQAEREELETKYRVEREKELAEWKKDQKALERQMKMTDERMGYLNNRFGELAEHLVAPNIHERFNELGYHFLGIRPGGYAISDEHGRIKTEIDLLMENGETIMAIEVKSKPALKDIEHHIKRMEILREYRNTLQDKRKIQGAIAGAIFGVAEKEAALEAGFFVITQSGDTVKIDIPEGFTPREW